MWKATQQRLRIKGIRIVERLLPVAGLLLIGLLYYLGVYSERTGFVDQVLDPGLKRITTPVLNAFRGRPPAVPLLDMRLEDAYMDSLSILREQALDAGWLDPEIATPVPLTLTVEKQVLSGTITIREGHADRLADHRWPFHIWLTTGNTVLGVRRFDLQPVRDGKPLHAWLYQHAVADLGLPAFAIELCDVNLNGRDLGLYMLEGRADSVLLDLWGRGSRAIMRFDDRLRNNTEQGMAMRRYPSDPPAQSDWLSAPIVASRVVASTSPMERSTAVQAAALSLESFRSGQRSASDVFHGVAFAQLLALSDLLGAGDALSWWNLRFLADSASGKLVPLPQRGLSGEPIPAVQVLRTQVPLRFPSRSNAFIDRVLGDRTIYSAYIAYLDTFSSAGWLEGLLERHASGLKERERILSAERPGSSFETDIPAHCRTVIQQTLRPKDLVIVYAQSDLGRLSVANVHALPVEIRAVITANDTITLASPILLWPRDRDKPLTYSNLLTELPKGTPMPTALMVSVFGLADQRVVPIKAVSTLRAQ